MPSADEIVPKARISQSLLQECAELVDVPDRDLPPKETNKLWAIDRKNFGECRRDKSALNRSVKALAK
ncbi:hypothetical protein [Mesorhizobium sp. CA4]|uniref:hypothetical protein n=1 Tax=Mesorhizobium sp. CA4 TaxID=588499 RepID=UPI001CD104E6|nr:hypothetical protein [Mesorhizobium sp. CA4]MBZ9822359.1 hypothetical protein [Mesorhizobium sp. CA4]